MKIIIIIIMIIIIYYIYINKKKKDLFTNQNIWNNDSNNKLKINLNSNSNIKPIQWNNISCVNINSINKNDNTNLDNYKILLAYNYDNIKPNDINDVCHNYNIINQPSEQNNNKIQKAIKSNTIFTSSIKYNNYSYTLLGYAINNFYNQKYLIYESKFNNNYNDNNNNNNNNIYISNDFSSINNQLYNYLLVKIISEIEYGQTNINNNNIESNNNILYVFGPRDKINYNDIVNLSYGVFQIGPLKIIKP